MKEKYDLHCMSIALANKKERTPMSQRHSGGTIFRFVLFLLFNNNGETGIAREKEKG